MNPFQEFEKNASEAGFTTDQIETLKKQALEAVSPAQKQKVAAEQAHANYTEGFTKAAMDNGVSGSEAAELFKIAHTVTVETLPAAIRTHFGRSNEKTASTKEKVATIKFVEGFAKTASAYGFNANETTALLQKQGFDIEFLKQLISRNPEIAGALGGGTAGVIGGAMAGGGKGALAGGAGGALAGGLAGHAYGQGGQIKEQQAKALQDQQGFNLGNILNSNKRGYDDGMLQQQARETMDQSNIGAYLRNLTGSKPYATKDTPYSN